MAPQSEERKRQLAIMQLEKLLSQRTSKSESPSPFTLVVDTLQQSGLPLLDWYMRRAYHNKTTVVLVTYNIKKRKPSMPVHSFISAWDPKTGDWLAEIGNKIKQNPNDRILIVIENLNEFALDARENLSTQLQSWITPFTSVIGLYHKDIPNPARRPFVSDTYKPAILTTIQYLATTVFTIRSFADMLAEQTARDRSVAAPLSGLEGTVEGVLQSRGSNTRNGFVLCMNHKRRSGRAVMEDYFFPFDEQMQNEHRRYGYIMLYDHPELVKKTADQSGTATGGEVDSTFELGLTEKQKKDREGVILPHFDAQKGSGEGGRILYDMGAEDDFDEDEDEI